MPELPEAERNRELCEKHCKGKKLLRVAFIDKEGKEYRARDAPHGKVIEPPLLSEWKRRIVGRTFVAAHRRAKVIYWEFSGNRGRYSPCFSFGMTGSLHVQGEAALDYKEFSVDADQYPPRHARLIFEFSQGVNIAYMCVRGFARVRLQENPLEALPISEYAPDPIHNMPSLDELYERTVSKGRAIKVVLLEQKERKGIVCGLGNWLCDDILNHAGIHPEAKCASLSREQTDRLHTAIVHIVSTAIACESDATRFPKHWLFHLRWNKHPTKQDLITVDGKTVSRKTVGQRTTYFVPKNLIAKGKACPRSVECTSKKMMKKELGDHRGKDGKQKGIDEMKVAELKELLRSHSLPVHGRKADLLKRLKSVETVTVKVKEENTAAAAASARETIRSRRAKNPSAGVKRKRRAAKSVAAIKIEMAPRRSLRRKTRSSKR